MPSSADWRDEIASTVAAVWDDLEDGPQWIEAQIHAESLGDPNAVSHCGAQGLMQLMPGTAAEVGVTDPFDPAQNIWGGVTYLRRQHRRLDDIPDDLNRLFWSFAAYNAGLGYVWRTLGCARSDISLPGAEEWWNWDLNWRYFPHREANHLGLWADYHQVVTYVGRIRAVAQKLGARVR